MRFTELVQLVRFKRKAVQMANGGAYYVPKHMLQADLQDPSVPGAALSSSHSGSFPKLLQLMGLSPAVSHSCTILPFHHCAFLCSLFLSSSLAPSPPQLGPTATMAGPIFWPCLVYYFLSLL